MKWQVMVIPPGYPEKPTKEIYYFNRAMKAIYVWQDETDKMKLKIEFLMHAMEGIVTHCAEAGCSQIASWSCKAFGTWYDWCREHKPKEKLTDIFMDEQDEARDAMEA